MSILNSKKVISDSLKSLLGVEKYCEIIEEIRNGNYLNDDKFTEKFNGYFKIRQMSKVWYAKYYDLLENQTQNPLSFSELLNQMHAVGNRIEVSFVSKLMAAVNPDLPIWDSFVLRNLGLDKQWKKFSNADTETRIAEAVKIYDEIGNMYSAFLNSEEGEKCIHQFDAILPDYKDRITDVKKLDFMLWSKREKEMK